MSGHVKHPEYHLVELVHDIGLLITDIDIQFSAELNTTILDGDTCAKVAVVAAPDVEYLVPDEYPDIQICAVNPPGEGACNVCITRIKS